MPKSKKRKPATDLPPSFGISERVRNWAKLHGYADLDQHLEYFMLKVEANGYRYTSWDAALMTAIRDDWAKLRTKNKTAGGDIVKVGQSLGIDPKIGESMDAYERRVMSARQ